MTVDALARATAYSAALATAKMARMLAANGTLNEPQIEELRIIATNPFDLVQIGNPALPQAEKDMIRRMREVLDGQWDDACQEARERD